MDKQELEKKIVAWLQKFLQEKFAKSHEILEVFSPESNLSKLPNKHIKTVSNSSAWEFKPDVLGILKNKSSGEIEFVLANRSTSALSLKEIGELYCYSKLVGSKLSFLISSNGISNEVNILLLEDEIRNRLLKYDNGREIIIFSWDVRRDDIDADSIVPLDKKGFLLS